ncbi:MAG: hypothetical protein RLZZ387_2544 [Chloroflexota bacterium]|jgi:hypothetical protein
MNVADQEIWFHERMLDPIDLSAFEEFATWIYNDLVRQALRRAGVGADPMLRVDQ